MFFQLNQRSFTPATHSLLAFSTQKTSPQYAADESSNPNASSALNDTTVPTLEISMIQDNVDGTPEIQNSVAEGPENEDNLNTSPRNWKKGERFEGRDLDTGEMIAGKILSQAGKSTGVH